MKCERCGHVSGAKVPLTPKQSAVYDFIVAFDGGSNRTPTYQAMADNFGCSKTAIGDKLSEIERKGWIYRVPGAQGISVL
jgi:hypothetical protein